jgi:hypothetical protein
MDAAALISQLQGVIYVAPVCGVLIYAYLQEKVEKRAANAARAKAEARLRAVLRVAANLPPEEAEDGE